MAQLVKNPPAMWETKARSLGWEDPLEKGKATHSYSCLEIRMDRGAWRAIVHAAVKSWTRLSNFHSLSDLDLQDSASVGPGKAQESEFLTGTVM